MCSMFNINSSYIYIYISSVMHSYKILLVFIRHILRFEAFYLAYIIKTITFPMSLKIVSKVMKFCNSYISVSCVIIYFTFMLFVTGNRSD